MVLKKTFIILVSLSLCIFCSCAKDDKNESLVGDGKADLVVFGKIFTSEGDDIVEAFAVKGGRYVYVGDSAGAAAYIEDGKTDVLYHANGLVMPSCGNGHAHYLMAYVMKSIGTAISLNDGPEVFLSQVVPAAVEKARSNNIPLIIGRGWSFLKFAENMPTRQQLDAVCADIPMYFTDDEGHKTLANTLALVRAGIMAKDGTVLKKGMDIQGGEIVMGADDTPTGLLYEQAGTFLRASLDLDKLCTAPVASASIKEVERHLLSEGYTMYMDGWSNYFYNENLYRAAQQLDKSGDMHFLLGLSYEIESWMDVPSYINKAVNAKAYASKHVYPRWIKLFVDGTVEGLTGFCSVVAPNGSRGIVNWTEQQVADITRQANSKGLSMHIHTMGDSAVALAVGAYSAGGQDAMRNTVVHVRNVMPNDWQRMADHNIYAVAGMHWHHLYKDVAEMVEQAQIVDKIYAQQAYPIKSFFDYGINVSSHTDYPALSGSPDDPFGIMEVAVLGVLDAASEEPFWTDELVARKQVITALTINCAKQMFIENERGSIKTGKYADFILVDKDVLDEVACPDNEIHTAKVNATYFEGKRVFSRVL